MVAGVYAAFMRCFTYPDAELVESLGRLVGVLSHLGMRGERDAAEGLRRAAEGVMEYGVVSPLEHLQGQFSALFVYPAYFAPYESVYLGRSYSAKPFLVGEVVEGVERAYSEYGYSLWWAEETADHLANELGFMRFLAEGAEEVAQAEFLGRHLLRWVPELVREMEQGVEYWRTYGRYICEDRFCKRREQTLEVPPKLLERACGVVECGVRVSDYPGGVPPGVDFYLNAARLLRGFLRAEAERLGIPIEAGRD